MNPYWTDATPTIVVVTGLAATANNVAALGSGIVLSIPARMAPWR